MGIKENPFGGHPVPLANKEGVVSGSSSARRRANLFA